MTGTGFYEQKRFSPTGLGVVIALHAGALAAVALAKPTIFVDTHKGPIDLIEIRTPPEPPENPPPPPQVEQPRRQISQLDTTIPVIDVNPPGPAVTGPPAPPPPLPGQAGTATTGSTGATTTVLPPMRIAAEFDPRFAGAMQPEYPTSEQRAQRDGRVRLRVTIGTDGRVRSVERLEATSDAFWRATERHALARWRFRPATVDGEPVESTKVLNVYFRIEA